jgi:succinate dehydrogenase / fumarate reductase, cytochrome b subunit
MSNSNLASLTKKYIMGLTGLFLIVFLLVHCGLNCLIFVDLFNPDDNGATFLHAAHFMGTNILMRTLEIGLVIGFLVHIVDGFVLYFQNKSARPVDYAYSKPSKNSPWYSRSMALLGTLILFFLIIHASDFWIPNRASQFMTGEEINLFDKMKAVFSNGWMVALYLGGCFSLFWHLLHGFQSTFQSMGWNHSKYNGIIHTIGTVYAVLIPILFASMPIALHFGIVQ